MSDYFVAGDGSRIAFSAMGKGPLLFLVGAPVGMAGFSQLAVALSNEFTVVVHDPRGIGQSSSVIETPVSPVVLAGDLASLIAHVTSGEVLLFGTSGGAVTGLELLCRHEVAVRLLVAHEPPLFRLLPDHGQTLAAANAAFALAQNDPVAAMQSFVDLTEVLHTTYAERPRPPARALPPVPPAEVAKNRFFLTRMAGPTVRYAPDWRRLAGKPLCVAAGEASVGQPAHRAASILANASGRATVFAPGNHLAASTMPGPFADWLAHLLHQESNGVLQRAIDLQRASDRHAKQ